MNLTDFNERKEIPLKSIYLYFNTVILKKFLFQSFITSIIKYCFSSLKALMAADFSGTTATPGVQTQQLQLKQAKQKKVSSQTVENVVDYKK